jgi:hypothetical protein
MKSIQKSLENLRGYFLKKKKITPWSARQMLYGRLRVEPKQLITLMKGDALTSLKTSKTTCPYEIIILFDISNKIAKKICIDLVNWKKHVLM